MKEQGWEDKQGIRWYSNGYVESKEIIAKNDGIQEGKKIMKANKFNDIKQIRLWREQGKEQAKQDEIKFLEKMGHGDVGCFEECPYCKRIAKLKGEKLK